jgi:hypothetical protein
MYNVLGVWQVDRNGGLGMCRRVTVIAGIAVVLVAAAVPNALGASANLQVKRATILGSWLARPSFPGVHPSALSGTGVINGTVRDYSGAVVPGADVMWATADWSDGNFANTDAQGAYHFSGVPALAGTGQLWFGYPPQGDPTFIRSGATFADPGPTTFDSWPGRIATSITRGGPWADWSSCEVDLFGSDAVSAELAEQGDTLALTQTQFDDFTNALPGSYTIAVVTFGGVPYGTYPAKRTEALELDFPTDAPAVVESGLTSTATLTADEATAARMHVIGWASGSPGSDAVVKLANFPAGDVLRISGRSLNGHDALHTFATVTIPSPAPPAVFLHLRVPSGVPLGDYYNFAAQRVDGKLLLTASFQTCSLTASQSSIGRGSSIRLSGKVPFAFAPQHPERGIPVTIFKRTTASTQPRCWSGAGWTKVMTIKTTGLTGRAASFSTPLLHPSRTTWYVVRYLASVNSMTGSFWRGFTSVCKVRVY